MAATKLEGSARERLLAAATELFYEEGIHTVGIDRVIERAGVAKASLYSTFGSKEELVLAYLEGRAERRRRRMAERMAAHATPREKILALFDQLGETFREAGYRGCAFINASAEGPRDSRLTAICAASRASVRDTFTDLARDHGAADPTTLGRRLFMLYDGAIVSASMDRNLAAAREARDLAALLLDAEEAPPRKAR